MASLICWTKTYQNVLETNQRSDYGLEVLVNPQRPTIEYVAVLSVVIMRNNQLTVYFECDCHPWTRRSSHEILDGKQRHCMAPRSPSCRDRRSEGSHLRIQLVHSRTILFVGPEHLYDGRGPALQHSCGKASRWGNVNAVVDVSRAYDGCVE
jgi:hypothetical protein